MARRDRDYRDGGEAAEDDDSLDRGAERADLSRVRAEEHDASAGCPNEKRGARGRPPGHRNGRAKQHDEPNVGEQPGCEVRKRLVGSEAETTEQESGSHRCAEREPDRR